MKIRKIIVILIVLNAIVESYSQIKYFTFPHWIKHFNFPNIFNFSQFIIELLQVLSSVFIFIGVIKLIRLKKIDIIRILKFPIYLFVVSNIFWFITTLFLSTKFSYFILFEGAPWYLYIFKFISVLLLILIIINYWNSRNVTNQNIHNKVAKKSSRLFNWIIDLSIILLFGFRNFRILMNDIISEDIDFLNSSIIWFFLINLFCYYLVTEFLFLQTIGKLHNDSMVEYQDNKFKSILIRTFCRIIPFEPFSFLEGYDWHDSISKTKVTVAQSNKL